MDKINILYLIATLDVGGAEKQLVELAKRIDKEKFNPIVCCLTRGGHLLENELKKAEIEYFILGKKFKFDFSVVFELIHFLKQENIHILHTRMFTSNAFGRIAGIFSHIPIIIATEDGIDIWKSKFRLFIDWVLSHFTDKIICVSEGVRNFYHRYTGIPLSKLITIYGGVEITDKINTDEQKKEEFGFERNSTIITTIGRLVPSKGIKYLLYTVAKIVEHSPNVRFLIIGEGPQKDELKGLAEKLEINKYVVFTGIRKDIQAILAITDIFVLPSTSEGFGISILEAMAKTKPVVATSVGGIPEIIQNGINGFLVPPRSAKSLASAIISILENPQKGVEMGINGRKRVEKYFSIDETVRKTEELYKTLVKLKIHN
ncbi:glycosyltransferase [bacterium]|nr:glycosyltransferase [bacterium]